MYIKNQITNGIQYQYVKSNITDNFQIYFSQREKQQTKSISNFSRNYNRLIFQNIISFVYIRCKKYFFFYKRTHTINGKNA